MNFFKTLIHYFFLSECIFIQIPDSAIAQPDSPILFQPGVINSGEYESHPAFSPSGKTLYFLKCTPDINNSCTICISFLKNEKWTDPIIAPFSGQYYDIDPFVTTDGGTLYFCSNRPLLKGGAIKKDTDIWRVSIAEDGWGEPEHLEDPVNSSYDEYYPTMSNNGNLYFGSTRNGRGGSDIFRCDLTKGKLLYPENLGDSINTTDNEYEPFIAPDESYLIFMATRSGGLGSADFYISFNQPGHWGKAVKLPEPINSPATEWSPKVTGDGKYFFFSSTRSILKTSTKPVNTEELKDKLNREGNGLGDLYFIDAAFLLKMKQ